MRRKRCWIESHFSAAAPGKLWNARLSFVCVVLPLLKTNRTCFGCGALSSSSNQTCLEVCDQKYRSTYIDDDGKKNILLVVHRQ